MSNLLKSKLILLLGSITILVFLPLLRSNFNAPVLFHKWKQLTWDDFQGFAKPFTSWAAGINSNVYVEYDSSKTKYIAYAAMNNQLSWKKKDATESNYLLNHEQYHFNLTEYFSRKLNEIIERERIDTEEALLIKLTSIRNELDNIQDKYDNESDHSINRDHQRKWEFKIDSLLSSLEENSGYAIDYYSGGSVHMPSNFSLDEGIHESAVYRIYQLEKYDMILSMTSYQYISLSPEGMTQKLKEYYTIDSLEIIDFKHDTINYEYQAYVEAYDSIEQTSKLHLWVNHKNYFYLLIASFPKDSSNPAYRDIAKSFINSFKIIDTEAYWLEQLINSNSEVRITKATPLQSRDRKNLNESYRCATYGESEQYGFYGKPIFREDGGLLFPYKIVKHPDSLIQEVMLIHRGEWYSYEKDTKNQIFFIPKEKLNLESGSIHFGYLLKEDSIKECYTFYHQNLEVNPQLISTTFNN